MMDGNVLPLHCTPFPLYLPHATTVYAAARYHGACCRMLPSMLLWHCCIAAGDNEIFNVLINGEIVEKHKNAPSAFTQYTYIFTAPSDGSVEIEFQNRSPSVMDTASPISLCIFPFSFLFFFSFASCACYLACGVQDCISRSNC
jgi:hypothetical protein